MSPQDRRFSVPEITSAGLTSILTEAEITDWVNELEENEEFDDIVEFGNWILQNGADYMNKFKNNTPWKGEHYFRIAKANLPEWQLFIEEYIIDNRCDSISIPDLAREFRKKFRDGLKFPMTTSTLLNFLRDYLYQGKHRLGDIEKVEGERFLVVNRELLDSLPEKSDDDSDGNDEVDLNNL
jgi:hypothetical protein